MAIPYVTKRELADLKNDISIKTATKSISKISDYLYEIDYDDLDYSFAIQHFKNDRIQIPRSSCTSVRVDNWYGRNLDWFFDRSIDIVVRTSCKGRIPSIGVASTIPNLVQGFIEKNANSQLYKLIPFLTVDGINQAGVFINTNVVPQDYGGVVKSIPTETEEMEMFLPMFPRFVLDKFTSALEACQYAQKHISFFTSNASSSTGYDAHFMIGDNLHTYVLEIINNRVVFKEHNIMSNFHINPVEFNADGTVYTPYTQDETHNAMDTNKITEFGSGLERYNVAVQNSTSIASKEDMVYLMRTLLNYNNAYTTSGADSWYTEFVGSYSSGKYTVKTPANNYEEVVMPTVKQWFEERDRDLNPPLVWHTVHTSVYDIASRKLYIYDSSEENKEYLFTIDNRLPITNGNGECSVRTVDTMCTANGECSAAFGVNTHASATGSFSEGYMTSTRRDDDANAAYSHVEGLNNVTNNMAEHAEGKFGWSYYDENNNPSKSSIHYVGIGTNNQAEYRKNAEVIMANGDIYIIGVGGYDGKNIETAQSLQEVIASLLNK